jgi:quercetin dioxygenase-like cupin family protein
MSDDRPSEGALLARLAGEGLIAQSWSNGPGDAYAGHAHAYDKVIVVVRGSIRFTAPGAGDVLELAPGDRLDLPAGTVHEALVGPDGVICLEAHRNAGWLGALGRRPAGGW